MRASCYATRLASEVGASAQYMVGSPLTCVRGDPGSLDVVEIPERSHA